jgi:hypothetical protein
VNCEFLLNGHKAYIITRACCDGGYEALAVGLSLMDRPQVHFQSGRWERADDAIKELHRETAECVKQRFDIVDGYLVVASTQRAHRALSDPQDDSDWHHVQLTPTESEDAGGLASRQDNVDAIPREGMLPSPDAAGEGRPTSAEECVPHCDPIFNPTKGTTMDREGLDSGSGKEAERGEEGQPSTSIGGESAATDEPAEVGWTGLRSAGKKKKGKKGKVCYTNTSALI